MSFEGDYLCESLRRSSLIQNNAYSHWRAHGAAVSLGFRPVVTLQFRKQREKSQSEGGRKPDISDAPD